MKKTLLAIFICVMLFSTVAPTLAVAESNEQITHLINPTAVAVGGNYLYVADNVDEENNQAVILRFDITGDTPVYSSSYSVTGYVKNLSVGNNTLQVVLADSVLEIALENGEVTTHAISDVVDFAYGVTTGGYTYYALTNEKFFRKNADGKFGNMIGSNSYSDTKGLQSIGNYVYILHGKLCERFDGANGNFTSEDNFAKLNLTTYSPIGLFGFGDNLGIFEENTIYNVKITDETPTPTRLVGVTDKIVDVESNGSRLYVLTNKNQIFVYKQADGVFSALENATIGSDMVKLPIPTAYTGFTLVKSKGYPTNVIYQTTDSATSVSDIAISYAGEYLILDYQDSQNDDYYYVLVGNKFGWVKKSDKVDESPVTPQTDAKIQIVDTTVSGEVTFNAKFTSLADVYVYDLPSSADSTRKLLEKIEQTGANQKEATILQMFSEGNKLWYLVEYDQGKKGFVLSSDVGSITAYANPLASIVGDRQINASLFDAVLLYSSSSLTEDTLIQEQGKPIKLYSGDLVKVIRAEGDASFVQVLKTDGTSHFGWVESTRLIEVEAITTNEIVGLVALGVAIVLAIVFIAIFVKRKKASQSK